MGAMVMAGVGIGTGVAWSIVDTSTGTFTEQQQYASNTNNQTINVAGWVDVAGMATSVTIPAGTTRMFDARFTAEVQCPGPGWCAARIVYQKSDVGAPTEMEPAAGTEFAFGASDGFEANAMERHSKDFLPAGTYRVWVQASLQVGATSLWIDDTHLTVGVIRP
ncbi:hypothetical protein [Streptomyces sp. BPTC-684]|uniref:hypothetical protein n=1 Tax=Streptomyces sp. BPTC-684 TaxID=3043734 RepID=UPI0024B20CBD|nr:hypothetical protein [Streptomyces sp. BPTC-684]WHM40894.1 hypothetical protein QIY60_31110 [Streptomyces sp. BPTC-684]